MNRIRLLMASVLLAGTLSAPWDRSHAGRPLTADERLGIEYGRRQKPDVPYVPTSEEAAAAMVDMAQVRKDDVVYDLGCGDGRLVIAAVKGSGARGVGVDIDPERIRECQENAKKAGVGDRVRFHVRDLFRTDFRDASVLMLYLLPDVNLRLRPGILSGLRPGARVVSHDFAMGDWEPDLVRKLGDSATVYYWKVPANATGTWRWMLNDGGPETRWRMDVTQRFQNAAATMTSGAVKRTVRDMRVDGDRLIFAVDMEAVGETAVVEFEGRVRGDRIAGTARVNGGPRRGVYAWTAVRTPGTKTGIDTPVKTAEAGR